MLNRKLKWSLAVLLTAAAATGYGVWSYWKAGQEQQVERLITLLQLKPGMTAGEVGAGEGKMTAILAQRLGPGSQGRCHPQNRACGRGAQRHRHSGRRETHPAPCGLLRRHFHEEGVPSRHRRCRLHVAPV